MITLAHVKNKGLLEIDLEAIMVQEPPHLRTFDQENGWLEAEITGISHQGTVVHFLCEDGLTFDAPTIDLQEAHLYLFLYDG